LDWTYPVLHVFIFPNHKVHLGDHVSLLLLFQALLLFVNVTEADKTFSMALERQCSSSTIDLTALVQNFASINAYQSFIQMI